MLKILPSSTDPMPLALTKVAGLCFLLVSTLGSVAERTGKELESPILLAAGIAGRLVSLGALPLLGLGFFLGRRSLLRALVLATSVAGPIALVAWMLLDSCRLR